MSGHPSTRIPLDRDRIVSAAIDVADRVGLAGLSMRRLGSALGVEAMSLYRYVPGKEDLLDAMAESLAGQLDADPAVMVTAEDGWSDFVRRLALGVRRLALEHPRSFSALALRAAEVRGLRPPLRSPQWSERFLDVLIDHGFTDDAAVAVYRGFTSFLVGHLLLEVADLHLETPTVRPRRTDDPRRFPTVQRLRTDLAGDRPAAEFDRDLTRLLEGFAVLLSDPPSTRSRTHP